MGNPFLAKKYLRRTAIVCLAILLAASLTAMSWGWLAAPLPAAATRTPTVTPTATRSVLSGLLKQLSFVYGGGGGPECDLTAPPKLPGVTIGGNIYSGGDLVCLYGFREGETVQVRIYDPNNRLAANESTTIQDDPAWDTKFTLDTIYLPQLPNQAPAGQWRITAQGEHSTAKANFNFPGDGQGFTLTRAVEPGTPWYDQKRWKSFSVGETLLVDGVNFPKNRDIPVAIYSEKGALVTAQMVRTNSSGDFSAGFKITPSFKPGSSYVLVDPDKSDPTFLVGDEFVTFHVVGEEEPVLVCPNSMPSYLEVSQLAVVNPGLPNNVREKPGRKGRLLGKLYENDTFLIYDGPKCADGMVWWYVYSTDTGVEGWTPEGQDGVYWLSPLN